MPFTEINIDNWRNNVDPKGNGDLKYEIRDSIAMLFFSSTLFGNMTCIVDAEDLVRIIAFKNRWYLVQGATGKARHDTYYIKARNGRTGKRLSLHRFILDVSDEKIKIDHKNGNGLDCRKENMRVTNTAINALNRLKPNSNNTSGYLGVSWDKKSKKWSAQLGQSIESGKKSRFLGLFDSPLEASKVVEAKRKELLEQC